jgi:hypothetical protein
MKKQVLFVHGGGQGAHEEDKKLAANLRDVIGGCIRRAASEDAGRKSPRV